MNKCYKVKVCVQSIQYQSDKRHSIFPFSDPFRFPFGVLATPHFNDDFVKHFENVFEFAKYFQSALPQKCLVNVLLNPHLTGPGRDAPW